MFRSSSAPIVRRMAAMAGSGGMTTSRHTVYVTTSTTRSSDDGGNNGRVTSGCFTSSSSTSLPATNTAVNAVITSTTQVRNFHSSRGAGGTKSKKYAAGERSSHTTHRQPSPSNNNKSLNNKNISLMPPSTAAPTISGGGGRGNHGHDKSSAALRGHQPKPPVRVREGRNAAISNNVTKHAAGGHVGSKNKFKQHLQEDEDQHPTDFTSMALLAQRYGMVDIATSALIYERIYGKLLGEGKGPPKAHTAENVEEIAKAAASGNNSTSPPPRSSSASVSNSSYALTTASSADAEQSANTSSQFPSDQLRSIISQEVSKTDGTSTSYPASDGIASNAFQCLSLTTRLLSVRFVSRSTASTLLPLDTDNTGINTAGPYFKVTVERTKIQSDYNNARMGGGKKKGNDYIRTRLLNVTYIDGSSVSSVEGIICQPPSKSAAGNTLYHQPRFGALLSTYVPSAAKPLFFGPSPRIMVPSTASLSSSRLPSSGRNHNDNHSTFASTASNTNNNEADFTTTSATKRTDEDSGEEKLLSLDLRDIFVDYLQDVSGDPSAEGGEGGTVGGGSDDPFELDYQHNNTTKNADFDHGEDGGTLGGARQQHPPLTEQHSPQSPFAQSRRADMALQEASKIVTTLRRVVDGGVVDVSNLSALVKARTESGGAIIKAGVAEGAARSISVPIHTRAPLQFPLVRNTTTCRDAAVEEDETLGLLDTSMPTYAALQQDPLYSMTATSLDAESDNKLGAGEDSFEEEVEQLVSHTTMTAATPTPPPSTPIQFGISTSAHKEVEALVEMDVAAEKETGHDNHGDMQEEILIESNDNTLPSQKRLFSDVSVPAPAKKDTSTISLTTPSMPYHQRLLARLYYGKYNALQQRDCNPSSIDMVNSSDTKSANINAFTLQTNSTNQHQVRQQLSRHGLSGAPPISFAFGERELNGDDVEDGRRRSDTSSSSSPITSSFGSTLEVSNSLTGKALAAFSSAMLPILALQSQIDRKLSEMKSQGEVSPKKVVSSSSSAAGGVSSPSSKIAPITVPRYELESNSIPLVLQRGWISEREELVVNQQQKQPETVTAATTTVSLGAASSSGSLITASVVSLNPTTTSSSNPIVSAAKSLQTTTNDGGGGTTTTASSNSETDFFMRLIFGDSCGRIHIHGSNTSTPSSPSTLSSTTLDRLIFSSRQPVDARPESNAVYASWMRAMSFVSFHKVLENKGVRGSNSTEYQNLEEEITALALDGLKKSMLDSAVTQYQFLLGRQATHERHLERRMQLEGARKGRGVFSDDDLSSQPTSNNKRGQDKDTNSEVRVSDDTASEQDTQLPTQSSPSTTFASPMAALSTWFKSILSSSAPVGTTTSSSSSSASPFNMPSLKSMLNLSSAFKIHSSIAESNPISTSSSSDINHITTKFTGMKYVLRGEGIVRGGGSIGDEAVSGRNHRHPLPIYLPLSTDEFRVAFATPYSRLAAMLNRPYLLPGADQPSTLLLTSPPQSLPSSRRSQPLLRLVHCAAPFDPHSPFGFNSLESMDDIPSATRETGYTDSANVALGAHSRRLAIASVFGATSNLTVSTFHERLSEAMNAASTDGGELRDVDFFVKRVAAKQHITDRLPHHSVFHLAITSSSGRNVGVLDRSGLSLQESQVDWLFRTSQHIHTSSTDLIQSTLGKFTPSSTSQHGRALDDDDGGENGSSVAMLNIGCAGGIGDTKVLRQLIEDAVVSLNKAATETLDGGGERPNHQEDSVPKIPKKSLTVKSLLSIFQNTLKRNNVNLSTLLTEQQQEEGDDEKNDTGIYTSLYGAGAVSNAITAVVENLLAAASDLPSSGLSTTQSSASLANATSASHQVILPKIIVGSYGKSPTSLKFTDQVIPLAMSLCISSGHWWKAVHVFNKIVSSGIDGRAIVGSNNTLASPPSSSILQLPSSGVSSDGLPQLVGGAASQDGVSTSSSPQQDSSSMVLTSTMVTDIALGPITTTTPTSGGGTDGVRSFDVPPASVYMLAKAVGGPIRQQWYAAEILMGIAGSRVPWRGREQMRTRFLLQILQTHVGAFRWREGLAFIQNVGLSNMLRRPNENEQESSQNSVEDGYPVDLAPEEAERLEAVLVVAKLLSLVPASVFTQHLNSENSSRHVSSSVQMKSLFDISLLQEGLAEQQQESDNALILEPSSPTAISSSSAGTSELAKWMEKVRATKHTTTVTGNGSDLLPKSRSDNDGSNTRRSILAVPCLDMTLKHIQFYARPSTPSIHLSPSQRQLIDEAADRVEVMLSALRECATTTTKLNIPRYQKTESLMLFPTHNNHLPETTKSTTSSSAAVSPRMLIPTSSTTNSNATQSSSQQQNHKKVATALLAMEKFAKAGDWKGVFNGLEKEIYRGGALMDSSRALIDCYRAEIMDVVLTIFGILRTISFDDQQLPTTSEIIQDYSKTIASLLSRFVHLEADLIKETERLNMSMIGGKEVLLAPHYLLAAEIKRIRSFVETNFGTNELSSAKGKLSHRRTPPHPSQRWTGLVTHLLHIITIPTFGYVAREGTGVAEDYRCKATSQTSSASLTAQHEQDASSMTEIEKLVLSAACGELSWAKTILGCSYPDEQTLVAYNTALRDSMEAAMKQHHAVMSLIKASMLHVDAARTLPTFHDFSVEDSVADIRSDITSGIKKQQGNKVNGPHYHSASYILSREIVHVETPDFKSTSDISGLSQWRYFLLKTDRGNGGGESSSQLSSMQEVWMWVVRTMLFPPRNSVSPTRVLALVSETATAAANTTNLKIIPLRDVSQERQVRFLTRYVDTFLSPGLRSHQDRANTIMEAVTRLVSSRISSKKESIIQAGQLGTLLPSSNPFVIDAQTILKHISTRYLCESTIWGSPYTPAPPGVPPSAQVSGPHPGTLKSKLFGTGAFAELFTSTHPSLETTVDAATFVIVSLIPAITSTVLTPCLTKAQHVTATQQGGGSINKKITSAVANAAQMWSSLHRQNQNLLPSRSRYNQSATWEEQVLSPEHITKVKTNSDEKKEGVVVKPYAQWGFYLEGLPVPKIETHKLALRSFAYSHLLFSPSSNDYNISSDLGCVLRFYSQDVLGPLFNSITDVGIQQGFYSTATSSTSVQSSRALLDFAAGLCTFVGGIDAFSCSADKNSGVPQIWPPAPTTATTTPQKETPPFVLTAKASFLQLSPTAAREAFSRLQWQHEDMGASSPPSAESASSKQSDSMKHVFQSVQRQSIANIINSVTLRIPTQLTYNAINRPYHEVNHLATSLIAQKRNPDRAPRRSGELLNKHFVKYCDSQLSAAVSTMTTDTNWPGRNSSPPTDPSSSRTPPSPSAIAAILTPQAAALLAAQHIGHAYHAVIRSNTSFLSMSQMDGNIATTYFSLLRLIHSSESLLSLSKHPILPPMGEQLPPATLSKYPAPPPQSSSSDANTPSVVVHCSQRFWPNMGIISNNTATPTPTHYLLPISVGPGHLPIHPESSQHQWNPPSSELIPSLPLEVNKSQWTTICEIVKKTDSSSTIPATATSPSFGVNAPTTPLIAELLLRTPQALSSPYMKSVSAANNNRYSSGVAAAVSHSWLKNSTSDLYHQELQQAFAAVLADHEGVVSKYILGNYTSSYPAHQEQSSENDSRADDDGVVMLVQHRTTHQSTHKLSSVVEVVSGTQQNMWMCQFGARNPAPFQLSLLYRNTPRHDSGRQHRSRDVESSPSMCFKSSDVNQLVRALLAPSKEARRALHRLLGISMEIQFKIAASASPHSSSSTLSVLQLYSELEGAVMKITNIGNATVDTIRELLQMKAVNVCQNTTNVAPAIVLSYDRCYVRLQSQAALIQARNSLRGHSLPGSPPSTSLKTHRSTLAEMNHAAATSKPSSSPATVDDRDDRSTYCVYMQGFPTNYTSQDVKSFITRSPADQIASNNRSDGRVHPQDAQTSKEENSSNRVQLDESAVINVYLLPNKMGFFVGAAFVQVDSQETVDALVARNRDLAIKRFVEIKEASLETAHHILKMRNVKINAATSSSPNSSTVLQTVVRVTSSSDNVLTQLRNVEQGSLLHSMSVSERKDWVHNTASQTLVDALWARLVVCENFDELPSHRIQLSSFIEDISSRSPNLPVVIHPADVTSPICVKEITLPSPPLHLTSNKGLGNGRAVVLYKPSGVSIRSVVENYHLLRRIRTASSSSHEVSMAPVYQLPDNASGLVLCTALEAGRMAASGVSLQLDANIVPETASTTAANSESTYIGSSSLLDAMLCRAHHFTDSVWLHTKIGRGGGSNIQPTTTEYSAREAAKICFADYLVRFYRETNKTTTNLEENEESAEAAFFNHFLIAQKIALFFYEWALGAAFNGSVDSLEAPGMTSAELLSSTNPLRPTLNPSDDHSSTDQHHIHFEASIASWINRRGFGDFAKLILEKPKVDERLSPTANPEVNLDPAMSDMLEFQREIAAMTNATSSSSAPLDAISEYERALLLVTLTAAFPPLKTITVDQRSVGARMAADSNDTAESWSFSSGTWVMRHRDSFESLCSTHSVSREHQSTVLELVEGYLSIALQAEQDSREPLALPSLRVNATAPLCNTSTPFTTDSSAVSTLASKIANLGWRPI